MVKHVRYVANLGEVLQQTLTVKTKLQTKRKEERALLRTHKTLLIS